MRLLPLFLLAAACAASTADRSEEGDMTRELAGRTAGPPQDCVSAVSGASLTPRGHQTLVVERGATLWVNRLDAACPGLDPWSQLIVETHGSQYCRGDHIRTFSPGQSIPGPICVLGRFTPYRR